MADYESYVEDFKHGHFQWGSEPTFLAIRYFSQKLLFPEFWGFFFYAIISIPLRYNYITKNSIDIYGSLLVYVSYILVVQDMIAIRSAVSTALLLYIIQYKVENNWRKAVALIILATMFHYSAAIFSIVLLLDGQKKNRWLFLSMLAISYYLAITGMTFASALGEYVGGLNMTIVSTHFSNYENQKLNIFNLFQLGHLAVCLFGWYHVDKIIKRSKEALIMLKLFTIAICILPLFSDLISVGIRLSELFIAVDVILIPIIFRSAFQSPFMQKVLIYSYASVIFYYTIQSLQYWDYYQWLKLN